METLFTLPLFLLLSVQTFISILLLLPKAVSLPVAGLLKNLRKNTATASVIYTIVGAFALLSVASIMEVMRGAERVRASGLRGEVLGTVDFLRSQVSAVLAVSNLLFLLLNVALSEKACELDHTCKNFEAFKRQVRPRFHAIFAVPRIVCAQGGVGSERDNQLQLSLSFCCVLCMCSDEGLAGGL